MFYNYIQSNLFNVSKKMKTITRYIKKAARKVLFRGPAPKDGGGGAWPLRKNNFFRRSKTKSALSDS